MKVLLILSALLCVAFSVRAAAVPVESETVEVVKLEESVPAGEAQDGEMAAVEQLRDAAVEAVEQGNEVEAALPEASSVYCPDGWYRYQSRCFMFVKSSLPWHDAEEYCANVQASLASVHNPSEYRFLQQITTTAGGSSTWLGGFYLQSRWMWVDRSGFYYTNWYSQSTGTSSPCLYLHPTLGWMNTSCANSLRFICARNPNC